MPIASWKFAALLTATLAVAVDPLRGGTDSSSTSSEIAPPTETEAPSGLWSQTYLTGNWGGERDELKKDGVQFIPDWTGEVFGNPSGGARRGVISDGVFDLPLNLDLDPLTNGALKDTTFHVNAFYIYGTNLSQSYVGDFSITSNFAAYNTLRLDELWLQKGFWSNKVTVKVGNMGVDNEFFQSASGALFINGTFGTFTLLANNIPDTPDYPVASPGVRIQIAPDPHYYVMAGVYGIDDRSFQSVNNKNGILFSLNSQSGMFIISEAGYLLNQGPKDKGLQGTYRLGSFVDTGNFHTFESQAGFTESAEPLQGAGTDFGIYGVVDQQIYSQGPQVISLFTRFGGAPSNTNFVDYYAEGGFDFTGFIPSRDKDVAGLGVARSHVSQDFSAMEVAEHEPPLSAETVIEATYKIQVAPWWNIQPDMQYVVTPSGVVGSHNALVLGVRTYVAF
jgi:porin